MATGSLIKVHLTYYTGAVFRLYRQIPLFGLTPIGKNAHIAQ
jgi:hypothetical protein